MRLQILFMLFFSVNCDYDCTDKKSCGSCIQEYGCVWCTEPYFDGTPHCFQKNSTTKCAIDKIVSPEPSLEILKDIPLESKATETQVQLKPQSIKLKLRKGEEYEFKFQYAQAANFPIDLYYIMDLSSSMEDYKLKLGKVGEEVIQAMQSFTNNFQLGFGSFVDKVKLPFTSTTKKNVKNPCKKKKSCASPYSFINHLSISNGTHFSEMVDQAKISGNLDSPEGGFDALMQAMVCKTQIGWRPNARHLIVFSTDSAFHIAGDGKLAGIVEPNPAKCFMENNTYIKALKYDYPSVSHINYIAKKHGYTIFFLIVPIGSYKYYKALQKQIENSVIAALKPNSDIPNLIAEFYKKISKQIKITDDVEKNDVQISYSADCLSPIESGCKDVHVGDVINFAAKIKPLTCFEGERTIIIKSTFNESLTVALTVLCDCDCTSRSIPSAVNCSRYGNQTCGMCNCKEGHYGNKCECDGKKDITENEKLCYKGNSTDLCSGAGSCQCGTCVCEKRTDSTQLITGRYCECDNFSCPKNMRQLCSGNGRCECGQCSCNHGWTGDDCGCRSNDALCTTEQSNQTCSGKGNCVCGKCTCEAGYYGSYCEECTTCRRCDKYKSCVECKAHNMGEYKHNCNVQCAIYTVNIVEKIDDVDLDFDDGEICQFRSKENCIMVFKYYYNDNNIVIDAEEKMECATSLDISALVAGLIGSIVLAGIIMLAIWKLCTSVRDKREYIKFENERNNAKWHKQQNPLFQDPVTKFENPTYHG